MVIIGFGAFVRSEPFLFFCKLFCFFGFLRCGITFQTRGDLSVSWAGGCDSPLRDWGGMMNEYNVYL